MTRNHRPVRSPDRVLLKAAADSSSSAPTSRRSNKSVDRIGSETASLKGMKYNLHLDYSRTISFESVF